MKWLVFACLFLVVIVSSSCRVPNLETPECAAARDVVRQYYSLAIGGDPMSNPTVLAKLKALRTADFTVSISRAEADQYYFSVQQPTSYRVGECSEQPNGSARVSIKIIWRVNDQNSERDDVVGLTKTANTWLIDRIDVGKQPGPEF